MTICFYHCCFCLSLFVAFDVLPPRRDKILCFTARGKREREGRARTRVGQGATGESVRHLPISISTSSTTSSATDASTSTSPRLLPALSSGAGHLRGGRTRPPRYAGSPRRAAPGGRGRAGARLVGRTGAGCGWTRAPVALPEGPLRTVCPEA